MGAVVGRCECVGEKACVGVDVYITTKYFIHEIVTSTPADSAQSDVVNEAISQSDGVNEPISQSDGVNETISQSREVNEAILSQKVYGE